MRPLCIHQTAVQNLGLEGWLEGWSEGLAISFKVGGAAFVSMTVSSISRIGSGAVGSAV